MGKTAISKTLGPIHFEDLEPHRFEDLVRELAYDFRDWLTIEATGRAGSDDGFDIRAFQRFEGSPSALPPDEDEETSFHPMEGRLWKFQCKREKAIGPKKLKAIISDDIDAADPPYAYVLAAPANFSKAAYDTFRTELRTRGVMEFHLWGRAELEDMLHFPKNDHVLFTFFGISLLSRRRSRATELRSFVSVKNRLQKLFSKEPSYQPVLLRDTKDTHYPYSSHYDDFGDRPRWVERYVVGMYPLGIAVDFAKYFAVYFPEEKTWDYTDKVNLVRSPTHSSDDSLDKKLHSKVEAFVESFPRSNQAVLVDRRLVRFDSVVVVDADGDTEFECPHVYVDFDIARGPFSGKNRYLRISEHHWESLDGWKRKEVFPDEFTLPLFKRIHRDNKLDLPPGVSSRITDYKTSDRSLYDCDEKLAFLEAGHVYAVEGATGHHSESVFIKITNKRTVPAQDLMKTMPRSQRPEQGRSYLEKQVGRQLDPEDLVKVYEYKRVYESYLQDAE